MKYFVFPLIRFPDFAPDSNALASGVLSLNQPTMGGISDFGASSWATPMRIDCDPKLYKIGAISSTPYNIFIIYIYLYIVIALCF